MASKMVYVVTSGCYSDYRINAIFSTRELAQTFIDKAKDFSVWWYDSDTSIEEWPLDGQADAHLYSWWSVGMLLDDGKVVEGPQEGKEFGHPESEVERVYRDGPIVRVRSVKSAQHALKLAVEARQAWLRKKTEPVGEDSHE